MATKYKRRFLSQFDMAEMRKEEARLNAVIKRDKRKAYPVMDHVCGCGTEGCVGGRIKECDPPPAPKPKKPVAKKGNDKRRYEAWLKDTATK